MTGCGLGVSGTVLAEIVVLLAPLAGWLSGGPPSAAAGRGEVSLPCRPHPGPRTNLAADSRATACFGAKGSE